MYSNALSFSSLRSILVLPHDTAQSATGSIASILFLLCSQRSSLQNEHDAFNDATTLT